MFTTRTLIEARGAVAILLLIAAAGAFWTWAAAAIPILLLVFVLAFFRDPPRRIPDDPNAIVSPADGTIVEIAPVPENLYLGAEAIRVSIFLSIFDVHVQRAPIRGTIELVHREPGSYLDARDPRSGSKNESRTIGVASGDGFRVLLRQIAGKIARRIVGWEETGAVLARGQRIGMIRFGSRVELYLPAGTEVAATLGEHVKGGETIIARRA
jgi:phosphatidylserine decarboxylase